MFKISKFQKKNKPFHLGTPIMYNCMQHNRCQRHLKSQWVDLQSIQLQSLLTPWLWEFSYIEGHPSTETQSHYFARQSAANNNRPAMSKPGIFSFLHLVMCCKNISYWQYNVLWIHCCPTIIIYYRLLHPVSRIAMFTYIGSFSHPLELFTSSLSSYLLTLATFRRSSLLGSLSHLHPT